MAIEFHPKPGQILMCDFSQGFKIPEMVKNRPVIILSGAIKGRSDLATIIPLSTKKPDPIQSFHYKLPYSSMPMLNIFQKNETWVKGDMIYTVGFHRLNLIQLGTRNSFGKRNYFNKRLGKEQMKKIHQCVLHGLNLGSINTVDINGKPAIIIM